MLNRICGYCGSSPGRRKEYVETAKKLAELFVDKQIELVMGAQVWE